MEIPETYSNTPMGDGCNYCEQTGYTCDHKDSDYTLCNAEEQSRGCMDVEVEVYDADGVFVGKCQTATKPAVTNQQDHED